LWSWPKEESWIRLLEYLKPGTTRAFLIYRGNLRRFLPFSAKFVKMANVTQIFNMQAEILTKFARKNLPQLHPGDVVRVHQKIVEGGKERVQVFEGIVISTHGGEGLDASFTVRKIASGVGVERTYPLHSDRISKIEFKKASKVRRAKLYYLRDLSGKGLRMKDKKLDKDTWELIAPVAIEEDETVPLHEDGELSSTETENTPAENGEEDAGNSEVQDAITEETPEETAAEEAPAIEEITKEAEEEGAGDPGEGETA
jgi:large subunit ribosomal protein L19